MDIKHLLVALLIVTLAPLAGFAQTNIHLKAFEWDLDKDGVNERYIEVIKRGDQMLSTYTRSPNGADVLFMFDEHHGYSMSDTNKDGRFDVFMFIKDVVPQQILIRTEGDDLEPIDPDELKRNQEFWGVMAEEFPRMREAALEDREVQFWGAFSNIVEKAVEVREEKEGILGSTVVEEPTGEEAGSTSKTELIRSLLGADALTNTMGEAGASFNDLHPSGTDADRQAFVSEVTAMYEDATRQFIDAYDREFSSKEITELHEFFVVSETGRKYLAFMQGEAYRNTKGDLSDGMRRALEEIVNKEHGLETRGPN